jgi:hypothetical protein
MDDFDLGSLEVTNGGLDAFLGGNSEVVTPLTAEDRTAVLQIRPTTYRDQPAFLITGRPPGSESGHPLRVVIFDRKNAEKVVQLYKSEKDDSTRQQAISKLLQEDWDAAIPKKPERPSRRKLGSLGQLDGFVRIADDMLVHKSNRDLWALRQDGGGDFYIERMFDDMGAPLKG